MNRNMSGSVRGLIDEMLSGSVAGDVNFESGGGSNVTITPTLESGTKIADFTIDDTSGELYAPTPEQPIEYTAGDNITIEDGVISATDTTYTAGNNITIENGVISASGGGGLNYSTEEQVVGTWIDGKPLYAKVVDFGETVQMKTTGTNITSYFSNDIKMIVDAILFNLVYCYEYHILMQHYNNQIIAIPDQNVEGGYMYIQYTKTTD